MWSISQWIDVICSREPPVKLELPCFECCVFGQSQGFLGGGNWKSTGCGKNGDEPVTGILQKWEVPPFSDRPTICQLFHVLPVPRASPSPRAFVRAPPCVWQSRWCGPQQCSVRRNPAAFFLWNPRCSTLSAQLAEGYNDLFGLQLVEWPGKKSTAPPRRRMPWCGRSICRRYLLQWQFQAQWALLIGRSKALSSGAMIVVLHWKSR